MRAASHTSSPLIVPQARKKNRSSPAKSCCGTYTTEPGCGGSIDGCCSGPSVPWNGPLPSTMEMVMGTPGGPMATSGTFDGTFAGTSMTAGCATMVVGGAGGSAPPLMVTVPSAVKPSESVTMNEKMSLGLGKFGV